MDNLIKRYDYDMLKHEKKLAKLKKMEKAGASNYDLDDIDVSDDEKKGEYVELRKEEKDRMQKGT